MIFFSYIHLPFSMILFLLLSFFLLTSPAISAIVHIGTIQHAWWNQLAPKIQNWTVSCNECICTMVMPSSNITALNCLLTNRMCYLFANYSSGSSSVQLDRNSTFYFLVLSSTNTSLIK